MIFYLNFPLTYLLVLKDDFSFLWLWLCFIVAGIISKFKFPKTLDIDRTYTNYNDEYNNNYNVELHFESSTRFTDKNLMEAIISLSIFMLFREKIDFPEKLKYIKKYFYKKYPSSNKHFPSLFTSSLKNRFSVESLCYWLNKKLTNKQDKINILYFLAGISMIDGMISSHEQKLLIQIQELLFLDSIDLDAIIAMYTRHEEHQKEQNENRSITNNERRTKAKIEIYCAILETPSSSTFEEIKKAYRKLAMLNHPDKYEKAGQDMVNIAKERFIKIQEAYDFLEKNKSFEK